MSKFSGSESGQVSVHANGVDLTLKLCHSYPLLPVVQYHYHNTNVMILTEDSGNLEGNLSFIAIDNRFVYKSGQAAWNYYCYF